MSKWFSNLLIIVVCLTVGLSVVLCGPTDNASAETYTIPKTAAAKITWDPNIPNPDGYRIYQRKAGQAYAYSQPVWTGSTNSGTVYNLEYDTTYFFVVRAYVGTIESIDSDEVSFTAKTPVPATYTISTVAGEHGTISPTGETTIIAGADQTFAIQPDSTYQIADVKVDGVSKGAISSYTFAQVAGNHTIAATFKANAYQITASAGANGSISPTGTSTVNYGASKSYTIVAASGYHVADVKVDGVSIGAKNVYSFDQINSNHTLYASFAAETFVIQANAGNNGEISPSGIVEAAYGSSITYTFFPKKGYHISDVTVDGQSVGAMENYSFWNLMQDHTIVAHFSENNSVKILLEAEDGDIQWPMQIADDEDAGAGGFVWTSKEVDNFYSPSDLAGNAIYRIEIPENGEYNIWGRQVANDYESDSFFISIDEQDDIVWHTKLGGQEIWTWDVLTLRNVADKRDSDNPLHVWLTAGFHTLTIKQRESGAKLDMLLITNDQAIGLNEDSIEEYVASLVDSNTPINSHSMYDMLLSDSPDRSNACTLDGVSVNSNIYVFVEPITNIKKVEFFIDGVSHRTENYAPFDLSGSAAGDLALPFSTETLSNGSHTFTAKITKIEGGIETIKADVTVSKYAQFVSISSDRSKPQFLDKAKLSGDIYVFVEPITNIKKVEFFIDGVSHRTENYAPFDLSGSAVGDLALPFSTETLSNGSHTFTAKITKIDGGIETIKADVTVSKYAQFVSISPDRSKPQLLDRSKLSGDIYVFVEPITNIKKVEFFIDGVSHCTENYAPFDLSGSAAGDLALPFSTEMLSSGTHTFTSIINKIDGNAETIEAVINVSELLQR